MAGAAAATTATAAAVKPSSGLSSLIRLSPLAPDELPAHPDIHDSADSRAAVQRPKLEDFALQVLRDGEAFARSFHHDFRHTGSLASPPSSAPVDTLTRSISASDIADIPPAAYHHSVSASPLISAAAAAATPPARTGEFWAARRSYHADQQAHGTASWSEFETQLRDDHATHEMQMTPTLYDARPVLDWHPQLAACQARGSSSSGGGDCFPGYRNVHMEIREMCHVVQFPLKPRCFAVLSLTADVVPEGASQQQQKSDGFLVISIPVTLSAAQTPTCFYSSGRNLTEGATQQQRVAPVLGMYTAVQRTKIIREEDVAESAARQGKVGQIEWFMASSSDAKGVLPKFVQDAFVPAVLTKDVGLFMSWIRTVNPI